MTNAASIAFAALPARGDAANDRARRRRTALNRVRGLADLLDQRFRVPGTRIRFGYDAIVGLIPGVGDTAMLLIGLYPLVEGVRWGVRKRIIVRMLANLLFDWFIGLIPLIDVVLDVAFKANLRNARLLERELHHEWNVE